MRIKNENEVLNIGVRKTIIAEIEAWENDRRREDHYIRSMILKDQTKFFVTRLLEKQFDKATVEEMSFSFSNISIMRKIVDKLAKVYSNGVKREVVDDEGNENEIETKKLNELEKKLDVNCVGKTNNRFVKAHRNSMIYVKPCPHIGDDGKEYWKPRLEVIAPHLYDVVEDYYDRTKPMALILSNYVFKEATYTTLDPARENRSISSSTLYTMSDKKDQVIADEKEDEGIDKKEYIWWTKNYHFTTNEKGDIISEGSTENPIKKIPATFYAINQDNSFWAKGGDDLRDESISINALMTHLTNIGVIQGYGQFYMTGKNLPRNTKIGPNKAILLEYETEDPIPTLGFANANPNLDSGMRNVEMHVSMLLTTNNLSTSGVSMSLNGAASFPSGISQMIDKAESLEDINEQRSLFINNEQKLFEIINAWISYYKSQGTLDPEFTDLELMDKFKLTVQFHQPSAIMSEQEKVDLIKSRKDLGFDSDEDLIRMLHGDLTEEQASAKLDEIRKEREERMKEAAKNAVGAAPGDVNLTEAKANESQANKLDGQENY